jgi:hypothetical protein
VKVNATCPRFVEWGEDYRRGLPPNCRLHLDLSQAPARGKFLSLLDSAAWPLVSELRSSKNYRWAPAEVERLAGDVRVRGLEEMLLSGTDGVGDQEIGVLGDSPHFARLRSLIVWGSSVGPEGWLVFARGGGMPRLELLRLNRPTGVKQSTASAAMREFRQRRPGVELDLR